MAKPRMIGQFKAYTPNSKADMRYRQKAFLRSKDRVDDFERIERAEYKRLVRCKETIT